MGDCDDDNGVDVSNDSDIDEVDQQSYHQVDQQADLNRAALGVDHLGDHHVEHLVVHLVDLDKAALGVDHHGLEDGLLGRQRWGGLVASLSPVLCPAPLLGDHIDGLRVQDWLGIGAADRPREGRGGSITDTESCGVARVIVRVQRATVRCLRKSTRMSTRPW